MQQNSNSMTSMAQHVATLGAGQQKSTEILTSLHERVSAFGSEQQTLRHSIDQLSKITMILYEHNLKLEEKLRATEHRRIKAEAFLRNVHHMTSDAVFHAKCSASLNLVPTLERVSSNNRQPLLSSLSAYMRSLYGIDVIDSHSGTIRADALPFQAARLSMEAPEHPPSRPPRAAAAAASSTSSSAAAEYTPSSPSFALPQYPPGSVPSGAVQRETANARAMRLQAQAEVDELARENSNKRQRI